MNEVVRFLAEHDASPELEQFASRYRSLSALWENCPRVDWLLWILEVLHHNNRRELRLYACWCARNFWSFMDERSRAAVTTAERFARNDATKQELNTAQYAAVKAAKEATFKGDKLAAWIAWIACATTMFPSMEAVKHVLQRTGMALREMSSVRQNSAWAHFLSEQTDRLREQIANPFSSTRADTGFDMRSQALK